MKQRNQELSTQNQILRTHIQELEGRLTNCERDMTQQTQKTREMLDSKEKENKDLRALAKGTKNEQVKRLQDENKLLLQDNSLLMREVEEERARVMLNQIQVELLMGEVQDIGDSLMREVKELEAAGSQLRTFQVSIGRFFRQRL